MTSANRSIGVMVGCVALVGAAQVLAQDWPQWRGPHRDGKVTGFSAPQTWPETLTQKWKTTVGSGDATPALVGEKLYVFARQGENEVTLCLDAGNGKELWQDKYAAQAVTGPGASHPGPRSSPVVAEGRIVTLGVGGVLSCLDATSGKKLWRRNDFPKAVPQFFTAMSPMIQDGLCIAHLGGRGNGAIMALDLATGEPKWKWTGEGPEYASPALLSVEGTKQIVTLTEQRVVGVALSDGELLWQLPFRPVGRASSNVATPIVDGQTVIYTGNGRGTMAVKIEKQGTGFAAKQLWSNEKLRSHFCTPVLKDGLLFGLSDRGNFFCLDAKTGEAAWTDSARHGNFGAILDAGSVLLALPSKSELFVLKPTAAEYAELARIRVADKATYAHPVVAGNRVFVRDQDSVTLWIVQ